MVPDPNDASHAVNGANQDTISGATNGATASVRQGGALGAGSFQLDVLRQIIRDEIEYHYDNNTRNDILSAHHDLITRMFEQQVSTPSLTLTEYSD